MSLDIAFVLGEFPRRSETFVLNQITGVLDRGHAVSVYAGRPGAPTGVHPEVDRYRLLERVQYWPELEGRLPQRFRLALTLLAKGRADRGLRALSLKPRADRRPPRAHDVLIAHFGHVGLDALRLRDTGMLSGRLVTFFHGYDLSAFPAANGLRAYADLFRRGELFLAISRRWQERLIEMGCPVTRTAVHHMGVDTARFRFRLRAPVAGEATRVLSVGRLVEKKGLEVGLRAIARVAARHPGLEYTVAGEGPLRPRLERTVQELRLGGRVRFAGGLNRDGVVRELEQAHLFLAPSCTAADGDAEGIPVALMEAMSTGMPVVSTRHSGIPELVEDGVSGVLAPEGDVDAIAARLEDLVSAPQRWSSFGRAARAKIEAGFDAGRLTDRLVERLQALQPGR
jgi:colanic acid/amylovoran biosynthesis glycosyltransferase